MERVYEMIIRNLYFEYRVDIISGLWYFFLMLKVNMILRVSYSTVFQRVKLVGVGKVDISFFLLVRLFRIFFLLLIFI